MTTTTAHPTHGEPLTAADFGWTYYQVPFTFLDDDGETVMGLGHITPDRFVAAARRAYREVCQGDLGDYFGTASEALGAVRHKWAVTSPACTSGDFYCPLRVDVHCVPPASLNNYGWIVNWTGVTEHTPGAFPITLLTM